MKILICFLFSMLSVSGFATPKEGYLFSAKTCIKSMIACPQVVGVEFLSDETGRCGCLEKKDYFSPKVCIASFIQCVDGASYSSLYTNQGKYVGCGCFKTEE